MDLLELLRKPIEQISFDDVREFCAAQHREHVLVDYKRGFSSRDSELQVAKVVASFANTQGGLLIFGVGEERDGYPDEAPQGEDLGADPRQTIRNACARRVSPPVSPEVSEFLRNPAHQERGVIVVRVSESALLPHTVDNFVYVRVMDSSGPKAPGLDILAGLLGRRKLREDTGDERRRRMQERMAWAFNTPSFPVASLEPDPPVGVWVAAGPRFEDESPVELPALDALLSELAETSLVHRNAVHGTAVAVADGRLMMDLSEGRVSAFSADIYGNTVLYDSTITDTTVLKGAEAFDTQHRVSDDENRVTCVLSHRLGDSILDAITFARKLREAISGSGVLKCEVGIQKTKGLPLVGGANTRDPFILGVCPFDDEIRCRGELTSAQDEMSVCNDLFRRICWAWGYSELLTIPEAREMSLRR